jgi:hypothetical protein
MDKSDGYGSLLSNSTDHINLAMSIDCPSLEKHLAAISRRENNSVLPPAAHPLPGGRRRFVHLDDKGTASMTEICKHEMVRDLGIRYRDALMLDPLVPVPFPASLLVRQQAIIVNLEAIRMIICANQCYILSVPKVRRCRQKCRSPRRARAAAARPTHFFFHFLCLLLPLHVHRPCALPALQPEDPSIATLPTLDDPFVRHLSGCLSQPAAPALPSGTPPHSSAFFGDLGEVGEFFDPDAPYELRALEVALFAVMRQTDNEAWLLERDGYPASKALASSVRPLLCALCNSDAA